MKRAFSIIILFVMLILSSQSIYAQGIFDPDTIDKRIDEYVISKMDAYQIPGLALAIVKDNKVYKVKTYGVKNIETNDPLTAESIFHMASVSKPFSATAIMQLVEKGKMNLDDPLVKYLPYFKLDDPHYQDITIKQMLTHTSGIPDVRDYEWDKPQFDDGAAERYVRSLANEKMIAVPGEKFQYSNMAFDILADVIAKVSGITFEDYIKENILNPLGMKDSDFLRERIRPELRTFAHVYNLQPQVSKVYPYNRSHAPSSCLNASVLEMCNWAIANMNKGVFNGNRILQESSYTFLFEPQVKIDQNQSIGLSWFLVQYRDMMTISHGGGDLGYRSYILMIPEKSLAVILASNYDRPSPSNLAFSVINIILGYEPLKLKIPISMIIGTTILNSGVQKAIEQYRELKKDQSDTYDFRETQLNNLGYQLINVNRLNDAVEIFKLNVEMFPQSFNTYDSLGEAYMKNGDSEHAIENYRKSLEMNPQNENAKLMLKQMENKK